MLEESLETIYIFMKLMIGPIIKKLVLNEDKYEIAHSVDYSSPIRAAVVRLT